MGQEMLAEAVSLGIPDASTRGSIENRQIDFGSLPGASAEARAQALYFGRRVRDRMFPDGIFGEPAWDILLDLFLAHRRDQKLQVKTVCIGSQVPSSTALRHIALLEKKGLVEQEYDVRDNRRKFLRLSTEGIRLMTRFFEMTKVMKLIDQSKETV